MSEPSPADQRFRLTVRPPVRALAISSVVALVGAVLFVVSAARGRGAVAMGVGLALMGLGVLLGIAALVITRRLRRTLLLDSTGLTVLRWGGKVTVLWSDVEDVVLEGRRLHIAERSGRRLTIAEPPGCPPSIFDAATEAIKRRLDLDRGHA